MMRIVTRGWSMNEGGAKAAKGIRKGNKKRENKTQKVDQVLTDEQHFL